MRLGGYFGGFLSILKVIFCYFLLKYLKFLKGGYYMQKQTGKTVKSVIDGIKKAIKNDKPKIVLGKNPNILIIRQKNDKNEIDQKLSKLRDQYTELLPFVKGIKKHIKDITETTHVCAVYLLLCFAFQNWNSLFLLAEYGKNSAALAIIRMIRESLTLAELFVLESSKNEREYIDKWCSGEIIPNRIGREMVSKFFDELSAILNLIPLHYIKNLMTKLYQMESLFIHSSYVSILECISPYTENFDFEGYTGFYRTKIFLKHAEGMMTATSSTLKLVYLLLLNDAGSFDKINGILMKYNNKMSQVIHGAT